MTPFPSFGASGLFSKSRDEGELGWKSVDRLFMTATSTSKMVFEIWRTVICLDQHGHIGEGCGLSVIVLRDGL